MIHHGMTYRHDIVETAGSMPYARFCLRCSYVSGCTAVFVLPSVTIPRELFGAPAEAFARWELPSIADIHVLAAREDWSRHPDTGGDLCPEHRYGTPVAEICSHEAAQVTTDTQRIPVEEIQAALEEGDKDDATT